MDGGEWGLMFVFETKKSLLNFFKQTLDQN